MKVEEHTQIVQEIAQNLNDQAKVTELLNTLSNDYIKVNEEISKMPQLAADNEKLRSVNMKLFLQNGSTGTTTASEDIQKKEAAGTDGVEGAGQENKKKFEDLFNEKGELK